MTPGTNPEIACAIVVAMIVVAAIVLSALSWALPSRPTLPANLAAPPVETHRRFTIPILLSALSTLLLIVAIVLVQSPSASGYRADSLSIPLMIALALALAAIGGGPFTTSILAMAMRAPNGPNGGIVVVTAPSRGSAAPDASPDGVHTDQPAESTEVLRGGTTIGILERISTAGAIVSGFPEAVAVLVALKGVGRFTELSSAEAKERFIIGSIASLLWASACTLLVR